MMAFALYRILPKNECDDRGLDVKRLAAALHRTPDAVALKIWNIAAHDANRKALGRVGMKHGSKLDTQIWEWFADGGDVFLAECLDLLQEAMATSPFPSGGLATDRVSSLDTITQQVLGKEYATTAVQRANQTYFRNSLFQNYKGTCCMTGLAIPRLLIASHIKPWNASTPVEKTAATNGLLLNAFHDRAFDQGLMTIDNDYRIVIAHDHVRHSNVNDKWLFDFEGRQIHLPNINPPSHEFIDYHNTNIFLDNAA